MSNISAEIPGLAILLILFHQLSKSSLNHNMTVATAHSGLRPGLVKKENVFEVTEEAAIVLVEELVEMSVLLGIFVSMASLNFHIDNISLVQNN